MLATRPPLTPPHALPPQSFAGVLGAEKFYMNSSNGTTPGPGALKKSRKAILRGAEAPSE
jgi:hypothetical protein